MSYKIKWKVGNYRSGDMIKKWDASIDYNNKELHVTRIEQYKENEYCLPEHWFVRKGKRWKRQTTKTLPEAKKKCEKWFSDFIAHCSK